LIITFATVPDTAEVLALNLNTFQTRFAKFTSGRHVRKNDDNININLYFIDNKILYLATCDTGLVFKIFDAVSTELLKEYITPGDTPISDMPAGFKPLSTEKIYETPAYDSKIKRILHKLDADNYDSQLGIGAFMNKFGQLEVSIMIGHYHFRTCLNRQNLNPEPSKENLSDGEKIQAEWRRLKAEEYVQYSEKTKFAGKLVVSYYDPVNKQFTISNFELEKK